MSFLSEEAINKLKEGYITNYPFGFKVIDNFIQKDKFDKIRESADNLQNTNYTSAFMYKKEEHNKIAFTSNLGQEIDKILDYLLSNEFIELLEKCTGIQDLLRNDRTLIGAGVHRIFKDGYLHTHTDFNGYYSEKYRCYLDRRINLILYLNEDWKDEYGGQLLLSDRENKKIVYSINPIANRCAIFNTTKDSLHGHPYPLNCPSNRVRQSIAVYYYTRRVGEKDFEGGDNRDTTWYDISDYNKSEIIKM